MANIDIRRASPARRSDERQAQLMLLIVYPFCLVAALLSRLAHPGVEPGRRRSIFSEAHASAAACIPFAFR